MIKPRPREGPTLSRNRNTQTVILFIATLGMLGLLGCAGQSAYHDHDQTAASPDSPITTPEPVRVEHEHLHAQLKHAMRAEGKTGVAAKQVHQALADHFEQENELVMPLLGLLRPLSEGKVTESMRPAIAMSQEVERKLPMFLKEHRAIHQAVDQLEQAAEAEGKDAVAGFARRLRIHAQTEETVLYPTAILVGRQVVQALASQQATAP